MKRRTLLLAAPAVLLVPAAARAADYPLVVLDDVAALLERELGYFSLGLDGFEHVELTNLGAAPIALERRWSTGWNFRHIHPRQTVRWFDGEGVLVIRGPARCRLEVQAGNRRESHDLEVAP